METIDVVIIGCGPTGALLSAYLGRYGVNNLVLEREEGVTTDPRGITLDAEGLRCLQGVGASERFLDGIGNGLGTVKFLSTRDGKCDLHAKPIFSFDADFFGPMGHPHTVSHKQPALEQAIRDVIVKEKTCELRTRCTVDSISEDSEFVSVGYMNGNGDRREVKTRFLVGADGKRGFTRKMYLGGYGIVLEVLDKLPYEETWVALNWHITLPTPRTHPDFPLFKKGYSPEQVYEAFFPPGFIFLCNPERASVFGFEFVVNAGEDGHEMAEEEKVMEIVGQYLTQKGKRYGLEEDVMFPRDCMEVLRSRPFKFSARSCNKWALGRVIVCGDAAHVFPPFGGQGIASGFRDVLTRQSPPLHQPLLEAWYQERKQQLNRSLALTIKNGTFCTASDPIKIFIRDWALWFMQLFPGVKKKLERGARGSSLTRYRWSAGLPFLEELRGGVMFPQVFCVPLGGGKRESKPILMDDVIFSHGKKGMFQLVVFLDWHSEIRTTMEELTYTKESFGHELRIEEATFVVDNAGQVATGKGVLGLNAVRIFIKEEFEAETVERLRNLAGYDGSRLRREIKGKYMILRPDRFVFADCMNMDELLVALFELNDIFHGNMMRSRL